MANFNLAYDFRYEHFRIISESRGFNLGYYQHKASGYISQFHLLNFSTKIGLSYANTNFDRSSSEGSILDSVIFTQNKLLAPFVSLAYDNLDDAYFAKHGIKSSLTARYHIDLDPTEDEYSEDPDGRYFSLAYDFQSFLTSGNGRFTFIPQVYGRFTVGSSMYYNLWITYGGEVAGRHFEEQLPFIGLTSVQNSVVSVTILRLDLRYNFYGNHYLTAMYNHLIQLYNPDSFDSLDFSTQGAGLKYSYNSPIGPVSLTAHWSNTYVGHHFGAYFSFGYTF